MFACDALDSQIVYFYGIVTRLFIILFIRKFLFLYIATILLLYNNKHLHPHPMTQWKADSAAVQSTKAGYH